MRHDSFGVLGPWLVTADEIPDPAAIGFTFRVNGEIRQQGHFSQLVLSVPALCRICLQHDDPRRGPT